MLSGYLRDVNPTGFIAVLYADSFSFSFSRAGVVILSFAVASLNSSRCLNNFVASVKF